VLREEGRCITDGGGDGSVWWNNLCNIRGMDGVGVGRWFDDNLCGKLGDGDALFICNPLLKGFNV